MFFRGARLGYTKPVFSNYSSSIKSFANLKPNFLSMTVPSFSKTNLGSFVSVTSFLKTDPLKTRFDRFEVTKSILNKNEQNNGNGSHWSFQGRATVAGKVCVAFLNWINLAD